MADDITCIQETEYGDYFEKAGKNTIFLLSKESAVNAWNFKVNSNSSSYFNLPDDCWIVANKSYSIGNWMEAYNSDDSGYVEGLLRSAVNWSDDAIIRFFVKKRIVFQASWCNFLRFWDEFIAVEDDCPIIIPVKSSAKEALVFRPIGDILKIG